MKTGYHKAPRMNRRFVAIVLILTAVVVTTLLLTGTIPLGKSGMRGSPGSEYSGGIIVKPLPGRGGDDGGGGIIVKPGPGRGGDDGGGGDDDGGDRECGVDIECPPEEENDTSEEVPANVTNETGGGDGEGSEGATPAHPAGGEGNEGIEPAGLGLEIGAAVKCEELWDCTGWSECKNGYMTRACTDANNCGKTENKPAEKQPCIASPVSQPSVKVGGGGDQTLPTAVVIILVAIPLILMLLSSMGLAALRPKNKFVVSAEFAGWLERKGIIKELRKIGWGQYGVIYTTRHVLESFIKTREISDSEMNYVTRMKNAFRLSEMDAEAVFLANKMKATILTNDEGFVKAAKGLGVKSKLVLKTDDVISVLEDKWAEKLRAKVMAP